MKLSGIYKITCVENGHFYIGRTTNYTKRIGQHKTDLKSGKHKNQRMQHCYDKYGADSFVYELIMSADDSSNLIETEQQLLDKYIDSDNCMNINRSAKVFCDVPMTAERRAKIGAAQKGRRGAKRSPKQRKRISDGLKGHVISDETKQKISNSHKGKKLTEETKEILRERFSGENNPRYGKTGKENPNSVPVWQIDKCTGDKIKLWESASLAAKHFGAKDGSSIRKGMKKGHVAYGYYWLEDKKGQSTIENTLQGVNE
jgi:group I intron endonuclease